jgi:hypothetical protein
MAGTTPLALTGFHHFRLKLKLNCFPLGFFLFDDFIECRSCWNGESLNYRRYYYFISLRLLIGIFIYCVWPVTQHCCCRPGVVVYMAQLV